jgi:hypothetical protein
MYGISRGSCDGQRRGHNRFDHGEVLIDLTDSTLTDSRIPRIHGFRQKRSATPQRRSRPAAGPAPARGACRLAWSRTTAWNRPQAICSRWPIILAVNELHIIAGLQSFFSIAQQSRRVAFVSPPEPQRRQCHTDTDCAALPLMSDVNCRNIGLCFCGLNLALGYAK